MEQKSDNNISKISVDKFLQKAENIPIIDVRSPGEFKKAHIPNAINIPLFNDEERAIVGTIYKQKSKEKAILKGLEIVGPKMQYLAKKAKKVAKNQQLLVHCWRGGMRSAHMAWLFQIIGLKVVLLEGGYKAYRQYIKQELAKKLKIIILSGSTGSGKTDILYHLQNLGEQIIDLEGIAHHKGSAFGSIGEKPQYSTEQFENNLYKKTAVLDSSKRIWIEDESKSIGKNFIPDELFLQMRSAPVIKINLPKEERIKRLVKEYTHADKDTLIYHLNRIEKRLGPNETKKAIASVKNGDMTYAVDLSLIYYDKAYNHGLSKRNSSQIFELDLKYDQKENAQYILDFFSKKEDEFQF